MAHSSPLRLPPQLATPATTTPKNKAGGSSWRDGAAPFPMSDQPEVSEFLQNSRNSPEAHRRNYEDAQRQHRRVLDAAVHVFELHQLAEANREIEAEEQRRKQRVAEESRRIEKERQAKIKQLEDEARLAAQKAAPIPKPKVELPPPPPEPKPEPPQPQNTQPGGAPAGTPAATSKQGGQTNGAPAVQTAKAAVPSLAPPQTQPPQQQQQPQKPSIFQSSLQPAQPASAANGTAAQSAQPAVTPAPAATPAAPQAPVVDRHIEVHKHLKMLRKFMQEQAKANPALKARMGDMRRDIRKSFGQLTSGGLKENRVPVNRLVATLQAGLKEVPSELMDPTPFVLEPREPVEGASHNEAQLPSLYLYLLNIMSKAAISQFINESGADTRTAEAIGQAVVKVLSENDFLWRGKTMIDMLVAKYRVMCPVLFGFRGNDKTERGRQQVGWRKENGRWISEQYHTDRMIGLGAGFAAITLRDFSRVKRPCPWPPTVYWTALAKIVNTPPAEMSDTQCYVLKAMIDDNEARFMGFYGNAAVAALRCALIDFPSRMPKPSAASETLKVLAKVIDRKTGLDLQSV